MLYLIEQEWKWWLKCVYKTDGWFQPFLIGAIILLFGIMYYRSIKTVDLSNYTVNDIGLNDRFNQKGYVINKKLN